MDDTKLVDGISSLKLCSEEQNMKAVYNFSPAIPKKLVPLEHDISKIKPNESSLIVFDLETSGFSVGGDEILQISAVKVSNEFNAYIKPVKQINPKASKVNNLTFSGGILFYKGKQVKSVGIKEALEEFLKFLEDISSPRILIGHNIRNFDCKHIYHHLSENKLTQRFCDLVVGFIDTLPLFKEIYPDQRNHKQSTLVSTFLNDSYDAHNAIEDVRALQKLIIYSKIPDSIYLKHSFTSHSMWEYLKFDLSCKPIKNGYDSMKCGGYITNHMITKLTQMQISVEFLENLYLQGGNDEITNFLQIKYNGKAIGTKNKLVLNHICEYFEKKYS